MPYIKDEDRMRLQDGEDHFAKTAGELNYVITSLCQQYVMDKGLNYATLNEIIGVLTCAGAEFYRRVVVPYEDKKIQENGDVFSAALGRTVE